MDLIVQPHRKDTCLKTKRTFVDANSAFDVLGRLGLEVEIGRDGEAERISRAYTLIGVAEAEGVRRTAEHR